MFLFPAINIFQHIFRRKEFEFTYKKRCGQTFVSHTRTRSFGAKPFRSRKYFRFFFQCLTNWKTFPLVQYLWHFVNNSLISLKATLRTIKMLQFYLGISFLVQLNFYVLEERLFYDFNNSIYCYCVTILQFNKQTHSPAMIHKILQLCKQGEITIRLSGQIHVVCFI